MNEDKQSISTAQTILSVNTEFNADSVEWCPFSSYEHYLTCGTYHLDEGHDGPPNLRKGNVSLYSVLPDSSTDSNLHLEKLDVFQSGGVLDMKWCPQMINDVPVLGVACSSGYILILKLLEQDTSIKFFELLTLKPSDKSNCMVLSLDWLSKGSKSVVTSDNFGYLTLATVRESEMCLLNYWNAHSFESWISAFDYSQPDIIYSGGDDCLLKGWDKRDLTCPIFTSKRHTMGVTAISKSKINENMLVTGSYDENVFLWDTRNMKNPISDISLGGGIWRLKWHPQKPEYVISASMHNGFHVLSVEDFALKSVLHYEDHKSLAYGVDWCHAVENISVAVDEQQIALKCCDKDNLISSCSFYDKLLNIWRIKF